MIELPMNLKFNGLVLVASGRDILELRAVISILAVFHFLISAFPLSEVIRISLPG